jgi:hypothetical protein
VLGSVISKKSNFIGFHNQFFNEKLAMNFTLCHFCTDALMQLNIEGKIQFFVKNSERAIEKINLKKR